MCIRDRLHAEQVGLIQIAYAQFVGLQADQNIDTNADNDQENIIERMHAHDMLMGEIVNSDSMGDNVETTLIPNDLLCPT